MLSGVQKTMVMGSSNYSTNGKLFHNLQSVLSVAPLDDSEIFHLAFLGGAHDKLLILQSCQTGVKVGSTNCQKMLLRYESANIKLVFL